MVNVPKRWDKSLCYIITEGKTCNKKNHKENQILQRPKKQFQFRPIKMVKKNKTNKKKLATCGSVQFLLFLVKARETGRHLLAALVDVLLAVDLFRRLVQQLQHSTDDGLQRTSQVFPAIRLSKGRHVNKGGAAVAQVQGCVVSKITEIPMKASNTVYRSSTRRHPLHCPRCCFLGYY